MFTWLRVLSVVIGLSLIFGCSNTQKEFTGPASGPAPAAAKAPAKAPVVEAVETAETPESSEAELVAQVERDRADYKRMLEVLQRWYLDQGLHEKSTWAGKELHDLNKVRTYPYEGSGKNSQGVKLKEVNEARKASLQTINMADFSEADRIEQLYQVRDSYKSNVKALEQQYRSAGDSRRANWAGKELDDVNHIRQYNYMYEVDIQNTNLQARDSIVAADELYAQARKLHQGALFLPFINNKRQLKEALDMYVQLIKCYPTSDKIDDAAYMAGEISKEYFNDDVQALRYYEMALKFDPKTPHKARFQAAVIYDYRLHDRARAMAMYQRVLTEEPYLHQTNTAFAATRLRQLLAESEAEENVGPQATALPQGSANAPAKTQ